MLFSLLLLTNKQRLPLVLVGDINENIVAYFLTTGFLADGNFTQHGRQGRSLWIHIKDSYYGVYDLQFPSEF